MGEKTKRARLRAGLGTLSLILCIIGFLFGFSVGKYASLGDIALGPLGLPLWSNGDSGIHYTIYYSLVFFIPSTIIGLKFKDHFGAMAGWIISLLASALIILTLPILFII